MSWAQEQADAVVATFEGCLGTPLELACAVVDGGETAVAATSEAAAAERFEVGSVGKTFTATAVAALVVDDVMGLDDPISRWLDAGPNGDITVEQLATHCSRLPRLAPNADEWEDFDPRNPYAGYTAAMAEEALRSVDLDTDGADEGEYSNFGFQLLGLIVERAAGRPFGEAMRALVFAPLGMDDTRLNTSDNERITGHDGHAPTPRWQVSLAGPGGFEATIGDMLVYLQAVRSPAETALGDAISLAVEPRRGDSATGRIGLAWHHHPQGFVWHNGGTFGFRSCLGLATDTGRGAVALCNSGALDQIDQGVLLAAMGQDPRVARPETVGEEHDERFGELADLVLARDWDTLLHQSSQSIRDGLTVDVIDEAWASTYGATTTFASWVIQSRVRQGPNVSAELALEGDGVAGTLTLTLDDDDLLSGILIR